MDKFVQRIDFINDERLNAPKHVNHFKVFDDDLLNKCFFVYFLNFKPNESNVKEQIDSFRGMVSLAKYLYHNRYPKSIPRLNHEVYKHVLDIYKKKKEREIAMTMMNSVSEDIGDFSEMEFISFVYFFTNFLKHARQLKSGKSIPRIVMDVEEGKEFQILPELMEMLEPVKYKKLRPTTIKKTLRGRTYDVCRNKLNLCPTKYNLNDIFRKVTNVNIFDHFNGTFESGIVNIFQDIVPKNLTEGDLLHSIKSLKKEMKHL